MVVAVKKRRPHSLRIRKSPPMAEYPRPADSLLALRSRSTVTLRKFDRFRSMSVKMKILYRAFVSTAAG